MKNPVFPCIWCNQNAREMAEYYADRFQSATITHDDPVVVTLDMGGQQFMLLNGGDLFKPNPSISMMVSVSEEEVERLWHALIDEGQSLMELGSYPWSPKYGWVQDKFGVSWQLYGAEEEKVTQKFTPTLMFTGAQNGRAEEAIHLYTGLFPDSDVTGILKYAEGDGDTPGNVMHAQFRINGYTLMCMDSTGPHAFGFTEGMSLVVLCRDQQEVDRYWDELTADGGQESMCGWLKDKFGLSWQIVPEQFIEIFMKGDKEKLDRLNTALMKMKKMDIATLLAAYNGELPVEDLGGFVAETYQKDVRES